MGNLTPSNREKLGKIGYNWVEFPEKVPRLPDAKHGSHPKSLTKNGTALRQTCENTSLAMMMMMMIIIIIIIKIVQLFHHRQP